MSLAREPGDLGGASLLIVGGRQRREGDKPQSAQCASEKSDAVVVPKKPAKTRVTPVETVEERTAAEGKSAARNASSAQDGNDALTHMQSIGKREKRLAAR